MYVRSLSTAEEIQRFIGFGEEVYQQNPNWIPPDAHHLTEVMQGRGGFGYGTQIQAFWVEENDRVLATVAAVRDEAYNRHWNEQMGHLLFFEALPDQDEAVGTLIQAACDWLLIRGCQAARFSMLPGMQMPLTIDAYDTVPTIFHTYNPHYYHGYVKNGGFITEHGAVQYQIRFTPELAQRYRGMVERAKDAGVLLRSWDFSRMEAENETFTKLVNETFEAHWGFMPLSTGVMSGLTVELKELLVADFMVFAEVEGQTAGFVYSLPDLNQAFQRMRGKDTEANFPELQQRIKEIDHGVLLIIGVKQDYRGRGINLAMAAKSYLAMIDRGCKTGSYTIVLDDNWPSRRTAEKLGAHVTRNFNIYRKELN
jgi:ribosomal protein S18 acetylase RimI-like enzyme